MTSIGFGWFASRPVGRPAATPLSAPAAPAVPASLFVGALAWPRGASPFAAPAARSAPASLLSARPLQNKTCFVAGLFLL